MNAAGWLLMTTTPIPASNDTAHHPVECRILARATEDGDGRWPVQNLAAMTLANDLHDLAVSQR